MTTPNSQTLIQLQDTLKAYEAFHEVVNALKPIANDVNDYPTQIQNLAMQSNAGKLFASAISDWNDQFNAVWNSLQTITLQLGQQYNAMAAVEGQNSDLAGAMMPTVMDTSRTGMAGGSIA